MEYACLLASKTAREIVVLARSITEIPFTVPPGKEISWKFHVNTMIFCLVSNYESRKMMGVENGQSMSCCLLAELRWAIIILWENVVKFLFKYCSIFYVE